MNRIGTKSAVVSSISIMTKNRILAVVLFTITSMLLLVSFQPSLATSIRICSSIERDQLATNGFAEIYRVASESMSPLLNPGDMVAIEKSISFADIQVGDIIVFREPIPTSEESAFVISRVSEILIDPHDQLVFLTKGDANSGSILGVDFPIYEKEFIGLVDCFLEEGEFKE